MMYKKYERRKNSDNLVSSWQTFGRGHDKKEVEMSAHPIEMQCGDHGGGGIQRWPNRTQDQICLVCDIAKDIGQSECANWGYSCRSTARHRTGADPGEGLHAGQVIWKWRDPSRSLALLDYLSYECIFHFLNLMWMVISNVTNLFKSIDV